MHLYLTLLFHRDYFGQPDSSLSCSFSPQGLFPPAECISILFFFSTRIISASRIHLYLAFLFHRDYFDRLDSSPSCSFVPQGLFRPIGFIPILLFFSTGIISAGRIHLYLALLLHRDYFGQPDSSPSCSFSPQGLFRPAGFISILLFFSTGIISADRMHLYLALYHHRDYFAPVRCISILLFCSAGIILTSQMHPYLSLFHHRDYFAPVRCIPSWLFCATRIILPRSDTSPSLKTSLPGRSVNFRFVLL